MLDDPSDIPMAAVETRSLLVVEDNDTTRRRMSHVLRTNGYHVREAVDGLDALRKVGEGPCDAILLDLVLPRVDGWQFRATQLRQPELAAIPTIFVTVQPLRQPDRYALRATEIVHKPFEDVALLGAVDRACRTRPAAAVAARAELGGLFWSRYGEIACAGHAPDATSPRWQAERWAAVISDGSNSQVVYRCQHCPGDGSPIDRSRRRRRRETSQ
jgi:two-component system, chemotaxis family, chemotaxis protein CheY